MIGDLPNFLIYNFDFSSVGYAYRTLGLTSVFWTAKFVFENKLQKKICVSLTSMLHLLNVFLEKEPLGPISLHKVLIIYLSYNTVSQMVVIDKYKCIALGHRAPIVQSSKIILFHIIFSNDPLSAFFSLASIFSFK